jgi:hypothetical protein
MKLCTILHEIKSNKAACTDYIPPELIKIGGRTLRHKFYELIFKNIG